MLPPRRTLCERCGSRRLRKARAHTPTQRLFRTLAPVERYACGECGLRGWRRSVHTAHDSDILLGHRLIEPRDVRTRVRLRRSTFSLLLLVTALGAVTGWVVVELLRP